jgi:hypothetical protein
VLYLVHSDLELERARGECRGQVPVHRRNLDGRGSKTRRSSAEGGRRQSEWPRVQIQPLGIARPEGGRAILKIGPRNSGECHVDRVLRRVGRQVWYELDRIGREHRAASIDAGIDVQDGLEVICVGAKPLAPAGGKCAESGRIHNVAERSAGPRKLAGRLLSEYRNDARVGPERGHVAGRGDSKPIADTGRGRVAEEPRSERRNEPAQCDRVRVIRSADDQLPAAHLGRNAGHAVLWRRPFRSPSDDLPAEFAGSNPDRAAVDRRDRLLDGACLKQRSGRLESGTVHGHICRHAQDPWTQEWAGSK